MQMSAEFASAQAAWSCVSRNELRGRILKLRWIGMEDEALELSEMLADAAPLECPLIEPLETD